ncbi:protein app1-like [Anguilla anguilla]|uniref:protein app1-like n=1 Tax=Anguilla anguilla TaxID=7936 RepID=UPI0015A84B47|nr:protein app1-like [Anguilla anguilla]
MKTAIACLCFASTICAAPMTSLYDYLPQIGVPRQPSQPPQRTTNYVAPAPPAQQPGMAAPISMEIVFPPRFPSQVTGGQQTGSAFPSQAFIKYKIPKVPGRQSMEIFYPYDLIQQQQMLPNVPQMPAIPNIPQFPQIPNLFPYGFLPPTGPQQNNMFPSFGVQQQLPQEPVQAQQPAQSSQPAQPAQAGLNGPAAP